MISFATVGDYNARAKIPVDTDEGKNLVRVKLQDASAKIALELAASGIDYHRIKTSEIYRAVLVNITCSMVERSMLSTLPGVKSRQQTAGPYSYTDSFANPTGDLYLLASERKTLGIGGARFGSIAPARHRRHRGRGRKCHHSSQ